MNTGKRMNIVDAYSARQKILSSKLYIQELTIHPLEVLAGFDQTSLSRSPSEEDKLLDEFPFLSATKLIVAFDGVPIMLNSFKATDILDSFESLATRISAKYVSDILRELLPLAGNLITNLDMFGRPAGLVKNIGSGVVNFFYQPIHGAMQSPYGLITGIRTGTTVLVSEVLSSALGSASTIVDNATKTVVQGATFLTGDEEFSKQQQNRRINSKRRHGGAVQGTNH
jgi:vacuolar protein sorting-associated protein 13A/C